MSEQRDEFIESAVPDAPAKPVAVERSPEVERRIAEMEARLVAARKVSEPAPGSQGLERTTDWQPIDTAPKDGTNVLLVNLRGLMATALWQDGQWVLRGGVASSFFNRHWPTHWMSLPLPPSSRAPEPVDAPAASIETHCKMLKLPVPVTEFQFHDTRGWMFDFAWPDKWIALEVEGIVYPEKGEYRAGGRHASVTGITEDIEKYGEAFRLGWRVLRCLPEHVNNGQALLWAEPQLR